MRKSTLNLQNRLLNIHIQLESLSLQEDTGVTGGSILNYKIELDKESE